MRKTFALIAVAVLASGQAPLAQSDKANELPYAGRWKLNIAKSDFGETTVTVAKVGPDNAEMQFTMAGQSYKFRVDGKDYPSIMGRTSAWKQIDANTWETLIKQDGMLITTDTTRLAADGKTMTVHSKGPKPDWRNVRANDRLRTRLWRLRAGREVEDEERPEQRAGGPRADAFRQRRSHGQDSRLQDHRRREIRREGLPRHRPGPAARPDDRDSEDRPAFVRHDGKAERQADLQALVRGVGRRQDVDGNSRPGRRR